MRCSTPPYRRLACHHTYAGAVAPSPLTAVLVESTAVGAAAAYSNNYEQQAKKIEARMRKHQARPRAHGSRFALRPWRLFMAVLSTALASAHTPPPPPPRTVGAGHVITSPSKENSVKHTCQESFHHEHESVDWRMNCDPLMFPERECATQTVKSCPFVGDGNCCVRARGVGETTREDVDIVKDRETKETIEAAAATLRDVVLVVYDSDEVLDASIGSNFQRYGVRVAHLSRPFAGFGTKWAALKEVLLEGHLFHADDVVVVLDARDVLANTFATAQFAERLRALVAANDNKVVSTFFRVAPCRFNVPHPTNTATKKEV